MSSLFCEGCLVAAAVVVRFAVENVPAKGALSSSRDKSFIDTVWRSYCRDLEQVGPFFSEQQMLIGCQVVQLVLIQVEFVSTMKGEEAKPRMSSLSCC